MTNSKQLAAPNESTGIQEQQKKAEYEDYNATSQTYDEMRRPLDLETLQRALEEVAKRNGKAVSDLVLLDAGCGTGNYLSSVHSKLKQCIGVEFNPGMLKQARNKLHSAQNVELVQGSCIAIPADDNSVDACIITQVIHHLETSATLKSWVNVRKTFAEVARVLKPNGVFFLSTQTPEQHAQGGFWWSELIPAAAETLAARFPTLPAIEEMLAAQGLGEMRSSVPCDPLVCKELYLDVEGPFKESFRNGDSTWSLATPEELEKGQAWLREKIDKGEGAAYLAEREAVRARLGQTTTVLSFLKP